MYRMHCGFSQPHQELLKGKERKGRIYSLLMMYNGVFYILDGDLLNSALLI